MCLMNTAASTVTAMLVYIAKSRTRGPTSLYVLSRTTTTPTAPPTLSAFLKPTAGTFSSLMLRNKKGNAYLCTLRTSEPTWAGTQLQQRTSRTLILRLMGGIVTQDSHSLFLLGQEQRPH